MILPFSASFLRVTGLSPMCVYVAVLLFVLLVPVLSAVYLQWCTAAAEIMDRSVRFQS